ncbi:hypothetical protein BAE44_0019785, partial [Dichanthelium oligosanthes]
GVPPPRTPGQAGPHGADVHLGPRALQVARRPGLFCAFVVMAYGAIALLFYLLSCAGSSAGGRSRTGAGRPRPRFGC